VVFTLLRTGTLSKQDFIGAGYYTFADGRTVPSLLVNIREMQVGDVVVRNVPRTYKRSSEQRCIARPKLPVQNRLLVFRQQAPRSRHVALMFG
jgi:hypothetical protein